MNADDSPRVWGFLRRIYQNILRRLFGGVDYDRLSRSLSPKARQLLRDCILKNKGMLVTESVYNDPSVKSANYSVLSGDQSFIDHRDPKALAEVGEALAMLELERLIWSNDPERIIFKATERGVQFITGTKYPTPKQKRTLALFCIWMLLLVAVAAILVRQLGR